MSKSRRELPLAPLLATFTARRRSGSRAAEAILSGREWLNATTLDTLPREQLAEHLTTFYHAVTPAPWHAGTLAERTGLVRHGLIHLLRGDGPLEARLERCTSPGGPYHILGLGPLFWGAVAKGLDPDHLPFWTPAVEVGLTRLGYSIPDGAEFGPRWVAVCRAYRQILAAEPAQMATDLDAFLNAVAGMEGRELGLEVEPAEHLRSELARIIRELRTELPLKQRAAAHAMRLTAVREGLEAAALARDGRQAARALGNGLLGGGDPSLAPEAGARLPALLARLTTVRSVEAWPADLDQDVATFGLWFVASVLHVYHPTRFPLWSESVAAELPVLDDAFHPRLAPLDQYRLLCEVMAGLRQQYRLHPSEVVPALEALARAGAASPSQGRSSDGPHFDGFCTDTFQFLQELAQHNQTAWMARQRARYRFVVREPLVELCEALASRYVQPVLAGEYGWDLETTARPGKALTSVTRTDFGRGGPYAPVLCINFARRRQGPLRDDARFFVRLDPAGLAIGVRIGRQAREAGRRFRKNVQEQGDLLFAALRATGATETCLFGDSTSTGKRLRSAADLRAWAVEKELLAYRSFPADLATLRTDELVGEVLILFDRLVPLFAAAVEDQPRRLLARRAGLPDGRPGFDRDAFRATTFLNGVWLDRTLELLQLKKQLILQGVPGTGKTHVARALARYLTGDRSDCIQLIQFHPGYSYEEFVEGIRPRSTEVNGKSEVTYPVEPGLLVSFAARAAAHPADPHVLVIDEINRGNLPRVFGELLFLLEYRDQEVTLPYSKAPFRLPKNLYLIGTMNPADRSAEGLDQALRRRFSFQEMPPDAGILARWWEAHPPADPDATFAPRLLRWFEDLNRRLARDLGADHQIGHSFFMVPGLTLDGLRAIWDHHLRPLLQDLFPGRPERVRALEPTRLFETRPRPAVRGAD